ncbi:MAG: hypothetical protein UFI53_10080, partial [Hallella sp.]|uniref:hypothetical protein n=1 Tax=Hallella sp. TaxID=2980186 RepID=UPI002E7955EC
ILIHSAKVLLLDNHVSFGNIVFGLASARPTPQGLSGAPEMPSNDWDEMKLYYNTVRTFPIPDERTRKHMKEQLDKQLQQAQEH